MNQWTSPSHKHFYRLIAPILVATLLGALLDLVLSDPKSHIAQSAAETVATTPVQSIVSQSIHANHVLVGEGGTPSSIANTNSISQALTNQDQHQFEDPALLASVNGELLFVEDLQKAIVTDQTLQRFFGMEMGDSDKPLERFVNQAIVLNAANVASFVLDPAMIEQNLAALLSRNGKSAEDLSRVLSSENIERSFFDDYFRRILIADRFINQQAAALNIAPGTLLKQMKASAHVSFGPAAAHLDRIGQPIAEKPTENRLELATTVPHAFVDHTSGNSSIFPPLNLPASHAAETADKSSVLNQNTTVADTNPTKVADSNIEQPETTSVETATESVRGTALGQLAPDFSLPQLGHDSILSFAQLRGKPTVLSFWVTWCPYCQKQTPVLVAAAEQQTSGKIQFIGINVKEESATVQAYVDAANIHYPILLDSDGATAQAYGVTGFPITYFLDSSGRIFNQHIGALSADELDSYISAISSK